MYLHADETDLLRQNADFRQHQTGSATAHLTGRADRKLRVRTLLEYEAGDGPRYES